MDNAILILMGDHGIPWSNYTETKEGLLERNLPFFMIRLPPQFADAYPEMAANGKWQLRSQKDSQRTWIYSKFLLTYIV